LTKTQFQTSPFKSHTEQSLAAEYNNVITISYNLSISNFNLKNSALSFIVIHLQMLFSY